MKRTFPPILLACLLVFLAAGAAPAVRAQTPEPETPEPEIARGPELTIYAGDEPSDLRIPAPDFGPRRAAATIQITYIPAGGMDGSYTCQEFSAAAQAAFQYAANVWAGYLNSTVPIRISACWTDLGSSSGILGSAGPYLLKGSGYPFADTWYPFALADRIKGADQYPAYYDITSRFNSAYPNWHFGTGTTPATGKYDFASVVLHEIGHGLGFSGSMFVSSGIGYWGLDTSSNPGVYYPFVYDRFTQSAGGTALISYSPNGSTTLGSILTSAAYFSGVNANAANGGSRVPLYTPATWRQGSSYSHLGEGFNGTANALMTYSLSPQEMVHDPGPVVIGILRDIGWSITTDLPTAPSAPSGLNATPASSSQIDLSWTDTSGNETGFEIYRSSDNSNWSLVTTTGANAASYNNTGLTGGTRYYYRIRAVNAVGPSAYSNTDDAITSGPPPAPSVLAAQATGDAQIDLSWTDNSNIETGFEIYRSTDNSIWSLVTTTAANATSYFNTGLTGGTRYYYRIRAVSAVGPSGYSNTDDAITSGPPPAPSGLAAQATGETQIRLTWTDNSNTETGFRIERSPYGSSDWVTVTTTAANATSYTNTGLTMSTPYTYRVLTAYAQGVSDPSNIATATTWAITYRVRLPAILR